MLAARLETGSVDRVVVLCPNTAISGQWRRAVGQQGLAAGSDRRLTEPVTVLTYQALAVFDPDGGEGDDGGDAPAEAGPEPGAQAQTAGELGRLHPNGLALVERLVQTDRLLLVLDESHHLLEVWGRLLGEILESLPAAEVLGLTATPPDAVTPSQAVLLNALFGAVVYDASIPALVREGDLAPFVELPWLVTPTAHEREWLAAGAERFAELTTLLTDPGLTGSGLTDPGQPTPGQPNASPLHSTLPFLTWLDLRVTGSEPWPELLRREPDLADAALRMHHAGLVALPASAQLGERHRRSPSVDDWMLLVGDWLAPVLARDAPEDDRLRALIGGLLPAVGYQLTRTGLRKGRSAVDRVLARSAAKAQAAVAITEAEWRVLGSRMRSLVLCDHERAGPTVPVEIRGVLAEGAGSAWEVLTQLVAAPGTAGLHPLLVTGKTVAGAVPTLEALRSRIEAADPELAGRLGVVLDSASPGVSGLALARLEGRWRSQDWVPHVTAFFEAGESQLLVGTRALLGEGWDARAITGLIDLTTATTATAVVQTRGRSLRIDPRHPDKVAANWTVTCVAPDHPRGDNDYQRLVRKHTGYVGIDGEGELVDGVAHLDGRLSPFAPPPLEEFDPINSAALVRAEDRRTIAELWRVGTPYADRHVRELRLITRRPATLAVTEDVTAPARLVGRDGPVGGARPLRVLTGVAAGGAAIGGSAGVLVAPTSGLGLVAVAGLVTGLVGGAGWAQWVRADGRAVLRDAGMPPSLGQYGAAVAETLVALGLGVGGAGAVRVELSADGSYRCRLEGVEESESGLFAEALDQLLAPIGRPRYLIARYVFTGEATWWRTLRVGLGRLRPDAVVWHPVPVAFGGRAESVRAFATHWSRWVGGGETVYTGSPEGAGLLAAQFGADPCAVTTVMRTGWE